MEHQLTLYTRSGCHLCEDAEALLRRLGYAATLVDIDADPALQARYGEQVPVLAVNGRPVLSGIMQESLLRTALAAH